MCSATVVGRCGIVLRRCEATRLPRRKISTVRGDARLDFLTDEAVRNAVVVLGDLDMIIEIDATALPLRILVGLVRQRQQRRTIELVEQLTPAPPPAPQRAI